MPKPISFGELDFNIVASMTETSSVPAPETPFRMLVAGDFSGKGNRGADTSAKVPVAPMRLTPIRVDRDNIDEVLDRLEVLIELPLLGENAPLVSIKFSELDDFHPDALYQRLAVFQALKDTRQSLFDSSTFAAFVEKCQAPMPPEKKVEMPEPSSQPQAGNLLDQIIEQSQPETQRSASASSPSQWDSFLHDIVKPHLVAKANPRQEKMIDAIDAATSELMRMILHHEDFQALESAWRGLSFLVSRLETDSQLKLFLLDVSKVELTADLTLAEDLRLTAFYKVLVEKAVGTAGGQPWAVVAGNYTFEKNIEQMEVLGRVAKIAKAAGTSFVAAAGDTFLCESSLAETPDPDDWQPRENQDDEKSWQALRHIPEAANLGLGIPRFLLRLPYGADTDPVEAFNFEEFLLMPVHANYLWGNPCFAIMLLLGQSFSGQGWSMRPGSVLEINSLPLHLYKEARETHLKPCAEIMLSQRGAELIIDKGLMPLLSFLNQDTVRLGRFQSIADPLTRLAGPWS